MNMILNALVLVGIYLLFYGFQNMEPGKGPGQGLNSPHLVTMFIGGGLIAFRIFASAFLKDIGSGVFGKRTSLIKAIHANDVAASLALIDEGVDVNVKGQVNLLTIAQSPLDVACKIGSVKVVNALIKNGARVNDGNVANLLPIHASVSNKHLEVTKILLSKGADVNPQVRSENSTDNNKTPLDYAIQNKDDKHTELLRSHGGKTGDELASNE